MTDLELSFQFPIKRDGASPVAAAGSIAVPGSVAGAVSSVAGVSAASGAIDSSIDGVTAGASSESSLLELAITIAARSTTPTRTPKRIFPDDPWRAAVDFAASFAAAARTGAGAGVVETLTRAEPPEGTGGMTTFYVAFLAADFFALFLGAAFLATDFLAVVFFLATTFLAVFFLATVFFNVVFFLATAFFAGDFFALFFGAAFLAAVFFFTATVISLSYEGLLPTSTT